MTSPRCTRWPAVTALPFAHPFAVINHDGLAVAAHDITEGHDSVGGCNNLGAVVAANINPAVECAFTVERIDALPEAACDLAIHRPEVGGGVWLQAVGA